jgi:hypothetical protein
MNTQQNQSIGNDRISRLLNKYVAVWLWSILFGATTGVGYTVMTLRSGSWGSLGAVLVLPGMIVLMFTAAAWLHLYRAFTRYLLPVFFENRSDEKSTYMFQYSLGRAFYFLFMASLVRIIGWLFEMGLNALSR